MGDSVNVAVALGNSVGVSEGIGLSAGREAVLLGAGLAARGEESGVPDAGDIQAVKPKRIMMKIVRFRSISRL